MSLDGSPEGPIGTDGVRLFLTAKDEGLVAVELSTGKRVWALDNVHGVIAVRAGLLVLRPPDGTLVGMRPDTGKTLWTTATGLHGSLPPLIDGNRVFVAGDGVAAVDATTGEVVWKEEGEVATTPPVAAQERLLVGETDGTLRCRDRDSGRSVWAQTMTDALSAAPTVDAEGRIFVGGNDRKLRALSLKDGSQVWSRPIGADVDASPVLFKDTLLIATEEGLVYSLTQKAGDIRWRGALPSRPLGPPELLGTAVLVPCREHIRQSEVVAFDAQNGRRIHFFPATEGEALFSLLYADRLYVAGRNPDVLACLRLNVTLGPQLPAPSGAPSRRTKPAF
jgi:outer membrane protein assembly factor BamB